MAAISFKRQEIKTIILKIIENKDESNIVSLYRELLVFNKKAELYLPNEIYDSYISELYNIIDVYLYNYDQEIINTSINNINMIITSI